MTRLLLIATLLAVAGVATPTEPAPPGGNTETLDMGAQARWVIAVHGGAGVRRREAMTPAMEAEYRQTLIKSLRAGGALLDAGGRGALAVEAALRVLEDSPIFNAGRGAALDSTGMARHDASIMRGSDRDAGAIAGSSRIRNPISAARVLMERTEEVLLGGEGADWFAAEQGLDMAEPLYFQTPARRQALLERRAAQAGALTAGEASGGERFGTVGAVVLDSNGDLSAGTSTGGRTNKRFGRIGDSPIIGAGTYAANESCAVSATGHGEFFMRWTVARDICARVELAGESLSEAAHHVLVDTLGALGGAGAVIALSPAGEVVFSMNENGMYRGAMSSTRAAVTGIWREDALR